MDKRGFRVEKNVEKLWISGNKNSMTLEINKKNFSLSQKVVLEKRYTPSYEQCG